MDRWEAGGHQIDGAELALLIETYKADGAEATRNRDGSWTFHFPDTGEVRRIYKLNG